jgi:hypothetical protein
MLAKIFAGGCVEQSAIDQLDFCAAGNDFYAFSSPQSEYALTEFFADNMFYHPILGLWNSKSGKVAFGSLIGCMGHDGLVSRERLDLTSDWYGFRAYKNEDLLTFVAYSSKGGNIPVALLGDFIGMIRFFCKGRTDRVVIIDESKKELAYWNQSIATVQDDARKPDNSIYESMIF